MKRIIVVIPVALQERFNADAEMAFSGNTDDRTFTVGLNPSGRDNAPVTHYWCSWGGLTEEQFDAVVAVLTPPAKVYESDNDLEFRPGYPSQWKRSNEVLASEGLKPIEEKVT